ncbi:hypothetical protein SNARM312S_06744 [Streptomyces narbonensis]
MLASRRTPLLIGAGARVSGGPMPGTPVVQDLTQEPTAVPVQASPGSARESGSAQAPASAQESGSAQAPAPGQESAPGQKSVPEQESVPGQESAARDGARQRVGLAQAALLSALVAGTPAPEGFDSRRLGVQSRALAAKRAGVVAKVAPELPEILGKGFRPAFLAYARTRPMTGGYRRDALDFAEHLLLADRPDDPAARRRLTEWWQDRSGSRPPGRAVRLARAARHALARR